MSAFDRLHPTIQEAVWRKQWPALRPLQVDTIHAALDTGDHLILAAATASGKTEAAFLPLLSLIAEEPEGSIRILYVSPLKALINDQFRRVEELCEAAQIPVHRWHGDVSATDKKKLRAQPGGVLLITPESMESQFVNYGPLIRSLYHGLRFVVIDELHSFLDDVRGIHLRSLLCRIEKGAQCRPRVVGLSATLGDFGPARNFLSPDDPSRVAVLEDAASRKGLRVGLKAYLRAGDPASAGGEDDDRAEKAIAQDLAHRFRSRTNLIFCNSRAHVELLADLLHTRARDEHWPRNPFTVHHGSLSKELREESEAALRSGHDVTVFCTATLEMGIDIGAAHAVGQIGPPWSVSSLVQRLGRSGRGEGQFQILRLYTIDDEITRASDAAARLFPRLLQATAMVRLVLQRWVESPATDRYHFSTCAHQILSVLRQTGGIRAEPLHRLLCLDGAFRRLDAPLFSRLLRGLAAAGVLQQIETGELILAPRGERIVEDWEFYAAFVSSEEYLVEHGDNRIGKLALPLIPAPGEHTILGGRRWEIVEIDPSRKRVLVTPSRARKAPLFLGGAGSLSRRVMEEMAHVLTDCDALPDFLDEAAGALLRSARDYWLGSGRGRNGVLFLDAATDWFPWAGTRIHRTLAAIFKTEGHQVTEPWGGLHLIIAGLDRLGMVSILERIAAGRTCQDPTVLAALVEANEKEKFDDFVPDDLLALERAAIGIDIPGAREIAERTLQILRRTS